jgi:hypothetical protein
MIVYSLTKVATNSELSLWEQYKRHIDTVPADDDFTACINAPPTRLAQGTTALAWWSSLDQREAYPALSKLAIDVLSAFAMSADSESIFSGCRRTISWERARLGGKVIEHSECIKDWQRSGIAYNEAYGTPDSDDEAIASSEDPSRT